MATSRPNPFAKFGDATEVHETPAVVNQPTTVEAQTVESNPQPLSVEEPKKNVFAGFDEGDEQEHVDASIGQALGIGAVAGAYKGAKNSLQKRENVGLVKEKGSQGYLSGMLPPDTKLTLKSLQEITGMPVRTQSEIQAALAKLQATPATREPRIRTTPTGREIRSGYTTTPATEHYDLSKFEIPSKTRAASTGALGGALAGAAAAPALYQTLTQDKPIDWTQWSSIAGALPTFLPKIASKIPGLNEVAPLLSIPYAIKHRDELMQGMTMNDVNPTAFPAGTTGSEESPLSLPNR